MTVLFNSFESPSSGTNLTTGNTSNADGSSAFDTVTIAASGTLIADTTHVAHGSQALKVATAGTAAQTYAWWQSSTAPFTSANGTIWGRVYCYFTANPASAFPVVQLLDSGTNFGGRVTINTSGKVVMNFGGSNSIATTSTAAIPLNTWFRLEFKLVASTTVGQTEVKIFTTSPDATSPDETNTSAASLNTSITAIQGARVGMCANTASQGPAWLDEVAFSDTGYIGPVVTAFTGTGTTTETATIAGTGSATGSGSVVETASIAASGSATGAGSVTETATIAGSGSAHYTGTGSFSVTASITGSAAGALSGTGAQTVTATVAGSGRSDGTGAAAVAAAIAGSGSVGFTGTGAVTVTATIAGSAPLAYFFNDAEDGTAGSGVTAGTGTTADGSTKFSSVTGSGSFTYDNSQVLDGNLSFKVVTDASGNGRGGYWHATDVTLSVPMYLSRLLYLPSTPSSALALDTFSSSVGTFGQLRITSSGKIELRDSTFTVVATSTATVPVGSAFRLEFALLAKSTTVGQLEARLFTNPYGTTPTETITSPATANTGSGTLYFVSTNSGTGPANYTYWFDQYRASAVSYPAVPTVPVRIGSGSLTGTASIAGSGVLGYIGSGAVTASASITGSGTSPTATSGAVNVTASITGAGVASNGASLTTTAGITGSGRTTTTGAVSAVVAITGTGALASTITPRTATSGSGNSQSVTTTLPTGTTAGDLLLCHLSVSQGGTAFTQPTISTPSGWTLIPVSAGANPLVSQGTNAGLVGAWYYRWATGTDIAPSWTLNTGSTFYKNAWTVEAYSGGPGSGAPRLLSGAGATGGSPATTNTTGTTTLAPASWYVETYSERSTTNTAYTNPSGRTRRAAVFGSGGAAADMLWVDSNLSAAGTVGGDTAADDGTGAAWQIHGLIVFPALTGASVPVTATITGSGSVASPTGASLTITVSITGTGVVAGFNPSLFVQQTLRATYTIQLVDAPHLGSSSAVIGDLAQAAGRSLTLSTPDGSNLSWTMPGNHPESLLAGNPGIPGLWEMCCDVILWRDPGTGPVKLWRGRVSAGTDQHDGNAYTVPWSAVDYKALFASKLLLDGDTLTFSSSTDVAAIAWALINTVQSRTNGNMGLTKSVEGWNLGGTANTGKTFGASFVVTPGTDLQSALNTLLAGDTTAPAGAAAGFDWWVDPDLQVHIKSRNQTAPNPPGRGTYSTFVADFEGTVSQFTRTPLVDQYANLVRGDGGTTPSTATAPTLTTDPMGRVERAITVTVDSTQTAPQQNALVAKSTAEALYIGNIPASSFALVLTQGVWDPGVLNVGDNVQVVNLPGRLSQFNGVQRLLSLQVDMPDGVGEQITLTTQRPDAANWQADALVKLGDRVRGLELRA